MFSRLRNSLVFQLEQFMVRGPLSRLAVIVVLVLLFTLVGGLLAFAIAPGFDDPEDAVWWAFLRLSDPGYLGDDQGGLACAANRFEQVALFGELGPLVVPSGLEGGIGCRRAKQPPKRWKL